MDRLYTTVTPELELALADAVSAGVVDDDDAPGSKKLRAWALYGHMAWLEERDRQTKIAAYEAIGADDAHLEDVREGTRLAVEHGLL